MVHVKSCCFANQTSCFFTFSLPSALLDLKVPKLSTAKNALHRNHYSFMRVILICRSYLGIAINIVHINKIRREGNYVE